MIVALTRPTGPELERCELTHLARTGIDVAIAAQQHDVYLEVLRSLGVHVIELPRLPTHPDAVFVEDTALVLDEVAVLLRPGVESRRGEVESVAAALTRYRKCVRMEAPGTLDGGDIIVFGKQILVGESTRTNHDGVQALAALVARFGYTVTSVAVRGVLHLKSAASVVDDETMIAYPDSVDLGFVGAKILEAPRTEPQGANVVQVGSALLADATAPRTLTMLRRHGADPIAIDVSEFAKAEGAISCKGVIFTA